MGEPSGKPALRRPMPEAGRSADGGLHLLVEHVENAGAMRDWIARRELQNIDQYIARGSDPAAVSFLQSTIKALQGTRSLPRQPPWLRSAMNPNCAAP